MRNLILFRNRRVGQQDRTEFNSIPAVGQEVILSQRFLNEALAGFPTENGFYKQIAVTVNGPLQAGTIITVQVHNATGTARIDSVGPYTAPGETRDTPIVYFCTRLT